MMYTTRSMYGTGGRTADILIENQYVLSIAWYQFRYPYDNELKQHLHTRSTQEQFLFPRIYDLRR